MPRAHSPIAPLPSVVTSDGASSIAALTAGRQFVQDLATIPVSEVARVEIPDFGHQRGLILIIADIIDHPIQFKNAMIKLLKLPTGDLFYH